MYTVQEIKSAISHLSQSDLAALREWLDELDAEAWDEQFEDDVKSGKLDKLGSQAMKDFQDGKCKEL